MNVSDAVMLLHIFQFPPTNQSNRLTGILCKTGRNKIQIIESIWKQAQVEYTAIALIQGI